MRPDRALRSFGFAFLLLAVATTNPSQIFFTASGTGSARRSLANKLSDFVSVKDFGATGDGSTDDTAKMQAGLDYLYKLATDTGAQGTLYLGMGRFSITAPLIVGKGVSIVGAGANFNSVIAPAAGFSGAAAIIIDGDLAVGGFDFRQTHRDYMIDCTAVTKATLPITIKVHKAYDIKFDTVWIFNGQGTGWDIDYPEAVTLIDPRAWGVTASAGVSEFGIRVHDSTGATLGASVTIVNPDIEVYFKGISQEDDAQVTILNPYLERNIRGWQAIGNTNGNFTSIGGHSVSPGASGTAAFIAGHNVTVSGGHYTANGGQGLLIDTTQRYQNVRISNVLPVADVSDARNYAIWDRADSTNWYPSARARNYKRVTSGAATTFYTLNVPFTAAFYGIVEVVLNARDQAGFSLWTGRYRFAATNADGTVRATAVTEYGRANSNFSGNYALAIVVAATVSGNTVLVQVTGTTTGAIGAGIAPDVTTEAELVQWDQAGGVYVTAN